MTRSTGEMCVAVDAMGGDHAPAAAVRGAHAAAVEDGTRVLLVGQSEAVQSELARLGSHHGLVEVVHAEEVVEMDEPATAPLRRKRRSSIRLCGDLVREGRARAIVSAGNTGAVMAVAKMVLGTIPGIDRPALAAVFPNLSGQTVVLDVGANLNTKPEHLRQFAVMGHFYAQEVIGSRSPRIGLLSIGEEEGKGTDVTREVYRVLQSTGLNFVGNVEGRNFFDGSVDVIVCDGFVGNVVLKSSESLARMVGKMIEQELGRGWRTKLGAALVMPALAALRSRTDPDEYGAAPLLGVQGGCFIGHGRTSARGIQNAVRRAVEFCSGDVHLKIREKVAIMHSQEERLLRGAESDSAAAVGEPTAVAELPRDEAADEPVVGSPAEGTSGG